MTMHSNWLWCSKSNPYICIGRHEFHVPTSGIGVAPVNNKPVWGILNIISSYTIILNPAINLAGQSRLGHTRTFAVSGRRSKKANKRSQR